MTQPGHHMMFTEPISLPDPLLTKNQACRLSAIKLWHLQQKQLHLVWVDFIVIRKLKHNRAAGLPIVLLQHVLHVWAQWFILSTVSLSYLSFIVLKIRPYGGFAHQEAFKVKALCCLIRIIFFSADQQFSWNRFLWTRGEFCSADGGVYVGCL